MPKKASEVMTNIHQELNLAEGVALPDFMLRHVSTSNYFKINKLQQKEPTEAHLFGDEDFIFYPQGFKPRKPVTLKMGRLLIDFCAGGKASYELNVRFIDKETQQIRPVFHIDGDRYPCFEFNDIVPFSLGDAKTTIGRKFTEADTGPVILCANQVRDMLTQLALGEPLHENQFQEVAGNFFEALERFNIDLAQQRHSASSHAIASAAASHPVGFFREPDVARPPSHDVEYFGKNFEHEPQNEQELAAKLAASFLLGLGINEQQIKEIIQQYLNQTKKPLGELNHDWIDAIMVILVDKKRYCLQTILPEDERGITLQNAIKAINQEQMEQKPPARL